MEKERQSRDMKMKKALTSNDPEMNRMIADQTDTIVKLKNDLTSKNNQFNRLVINQKSSDIYVKLNKQI